MRSRRKLSLDVLARCARVDRGTELQLELRPLLLAVDELARRPGDVDSLSALAHTRGLNTLGVLFQAAGRHSVAAFLHRRSAAVATANRLPVRWTVDALQAASFAYQGHDLGRARKAWQAADELSPAAGPIPKIDLLVRKAELLSAAGQVDDALAVHRQDVVPRWTHVDEADPRRAGIHAVAFANLLLHSRARDCVTEALEIMAAAASGAAEDVTLRRDLIVQTGRCQMRLGDSSGAQRSLQEAERIQFVNGLGTGMTSRLHAEIATALGG